jgi:hypothetical protein
VGYIPHLPAGKAVSAAALGWGIDTAADFLKEAEGVANVIAESPQQGKLWQNSKIFSVQSVKYVEGSNIAKHRERRAVQGTMGKNIQHDV